jgi:DNA-binding protein YbaB
VTAEMHPQVAAVLQQADRLLSIMDDQLHKMKSEKFTGTDESETVEVTLNGHQWLTDVFINDGLLRHGAEAVAKRLNEALRNATTKANASMQADLERLDATFTEIADEFG